jgi:hypothetical protein
MYLYLRVEAYTHHCKCVEGNISCPREKERDLVVEFTRNVFI